MITESINPANTLQPFKRVYIPGCGGGLTDEVTAMTEFHIGHIIESSW